MVPIIRRLLQLAAVPVALAAVLVPSSASATTSSHSPSGHSAAAATAGGSVVVGRILADGRAVAGAKVTLYAWPSNAVQVKLKKGDQVPVKVVGSTLSSRSGSYSITPANWAGLSAYANNGVVNMVVAAVYHGHSNMYFFPRKLLATRYGTALAVNSAARTPQLSAQRADLRLNLSSRVTARATPATPCSGWYYDGTWSNIPAILGSESSWLDSVKMGFTYGSGQSSSFGVGVWNVGDVSFKQSGTSSVTGGSSQTWPTENVVNAYIRVSNFAYSEYSDCYGDLSTNVVDWDGSDVTNTGAIGAASLCEAEYAPTTLTLSKGQAWTFAKGVNIGPEIGIALSSQTGYSNTLKETYQFTNTSIVAYACGRNDYPNSTSPGPGYVVASPHPNGG